jgi:hypothetical protein
MPAAPTNRRIAMLINREIAKGQLVPLTFMQDAVAASQTDVQLLVAEVTSAAGNEVDGYVMPFAGEIVAISGRLSAAGSAGTLTIGPTINGDEQTALTQTVTTGQSPYGKVNRETIPFAAGALIGAEITSNGSWNGTSADLGVVVWALLYLEGI